MENSPKAVYIDPPPARALRMVCAGNYTTFLPVSYNAEYDEPMFQKIYVLLHLEYQCGVS